MVALVLGLLGALGAGGLWLGGGVEMRLLRQPLAGASTAQLPTYLVAQSFYCTRGNLSRVDLQASFVPDRNSVSSLQLLEGDGLGGRVLYEIPFSRARFTQGVYLTFDFPPQADSQGRTYTVVVKSPGRPLGTSIGVEYSPIDALSGGQMYTHEGAGKPGQGDLAISVFYRYDLGTLVGDSGRVLSEGRRLVLSPLLLLLLPGLALLLWLPNSLTFGQRLLAAPALTALSLPIFFLVMRAVGLQVGEVAMWGLLGLCGLLVAAAVWRYRRVVLRRGQVRAADVAFWGLFGGVLLATLVSRFLSLRDQPGGVGIDAYHHTLIVQLFVQQGGIPSNYMPYAPLSSFTYHFGFHSLAASMAWLSGRTSISDIMLVMPQAGQLVDTLPVLTLTLFGWKTLGNRWAGLAAGALAGVVCVIPAYYVEWSRYTQALGLAVLPVSWILLLEALDRPLSKRLTRRSGSKSTPQPSANGQSANPAPASPVSTALAPAPITWQSALRQSGPYMLAVLGAAGLALSHYRIMILYAVFVAIYLAWRFFRSLRARVSLAELVAPLRRTALVAVLAGATLLPWLLNLRANFRFNVLDKPVDADRCSYYDLASRLGTDITAHISLFLMFALALGGLGWAWKRRDPLPLLPAVTWLLVGAWSNPCFLPFSPDLANRLKVGYLDTVTVASGVWLPLCLLAAYPLARLAEWIVGLGANLPKLRAGVWRHGAALLIGAAVLVGGLASGVQLSPIHDPKPYLTPGDVDVMQWMRANLSRNSYVATEPFSFPWSKQSVLGTDAGLWVPLVAGFPNTVPPMTAYNERLADPNYLNNELSVIADEPLTTGPGQHTTSDWDALKAAGVTHIFIGSRSSYWDKPYLFAHPQNVTPIYHKDSAWLFALR